MRLQFVLLSFWRIQRATLFDLLFFLMRKHKGRIFILTIIYQIELLLLGLSLV